MDAVLSREVAKKMPLASAKEKKAAYRPIQP